MKKNKKQKIKERKNLSIINGGDVVVIKDRSRIASSVMWSIILGFLTSLVFMLKDARDEAIFWVPFAFVALSTVYMLSMAVLGKIVLDATKMTITIYMPFKLEYNFSDVNYVDVISSKPKEGIVTHKVSAYIGKGKSSVDVFTTSLSQAEEVVSLLRGMLDSGAMEYPEGNEEPFTTDAKEEEQNSAKSDEAENNACDGVDFSPIEKDGAQSQEPQGAKEGDNSSDSFISSEDKVTDNADELH